MSDERQRPWVLKWIREEAFWRDVTTQAIGAVLVAILVFVVGAFAGILDTDRFAAITLAIMVTILAFAIMGGALWAMAHLLILVGKRLPGVVAGVIAFFVIAGAWAALCMGIVFGASRIIQALIGSATS